MRSLLVLALLVLVGCATTGKAAPDADEGAAPAQKLPTKKRKLSQLELKLEIAHAEMHAQMEGSAQELRAKQAALEIETAKLANLEEVEIPQELKQARLDLKQAQYRHQFATEELQQLEEMYKQSELEEKTSEIVLNRGRRQLELAAERLALQKSRLEKLETRDLPLRLQEQRKALADAERATLDLSRAATLEPMRKRLAVREIETEILTLKAEIAALEKKTKKTKKTKK